MVDVLPCLVISAASVCLMVDSVAYGGRITLSSDLSSVSLSHGGQTYGGRITLSKLCLFQADVS